MADLCQTEPTPPPKKLSRSIRRWHYGQGFPLMFANLCSCKLFAQSNNLEEENFSYSLASYSESNLRVKIPHPLKKDANQVHIAANLTRKQLLPIHWCQNANRWDSGFKMGRLTLVLYFTYKSKKQKQNTFFKQIFLGSST